MKKLFQMHGKGQTNNLLSDQALLPPVTANSVKVEEKHSGEEETLTFIPALSLMTCIAFFFKPEF